MICMCVLAGMDKTIRVYDLEKPDETPCAFGGVQPSGVRCLTWLAGDNMLLCSHNDRNGVT